MERYLTIMNEIIDENALQTAAKVNGVEYSEDYWKQCKGIMKPIKLTVVGHLLYGESAKAVKVYRNAVGCRLKEACEAVDKIAMEIDNCDDPFANYKIYN